MTTLILSWILAFSYCINSTGDVFETSEIELRSVVSDDFTKVIIDIKLPESKNVGFELYNNKNHILHFWHDKNLNTGKHKLSLALPDLEKGKYLLKIKVGEEIFKHLVMIL